MALIGGLGTITGPVIGAFVVIAMHDYLAFVGQLVLVIQGFIFVVINIGVDLLYVLIDPRLRGR